MNTFMGIALEVWVNLDEDCAIECEVGRTEVQIELGHKTGSLHVVATEGALANLMEKVGAALQDMRSEDLTGPASVGLSRATDGCNRHA
jgi:hypothetical protein